MLSVPEPAETSNSDICLLKFSVGHVEEKESFNDTYDGRDEGPTEEQVQNSPFRLIQVKPVNADTTK
jgi:hypothetical protein